MDHDTLAGLLQRYGYIVIFLGVVVEGETPLLMGGFAAHGGYLELPWVLFWAFLGAVAGDQGWFFLGRYRGPRLLEKHPKWRPRIERVDKLVQKYSTAFVLAFRFLYGLRTVSPIAIGMTRISALRFLALDVLGSAIWTAFFGGLGYVFGSAIGRFLGKVEGYEVAIFGAMAAVGAIVWAVHWLRQRRERLPAPAAAAGDGGG